ncbi:unnamed protein product [Owenia fusiformis]|uniref:Uncharacterized protein n=1 Tax=Owenia fusiformis TaxID=6347 RepID=A0A8J1U5R2_OWEFU|nr:unnamed protein product [Owenia fusiformis]
MYENSESYTEDEIREQLTQLGYTNIPQHRLREFKKDLDVLIQHERSKNSSRSYDTSNLSTYTDTASQHEYDRGYSKANRATMGYERQQYRDETDVKQYIQRDTSDARYDKENLYAGSSQSKPREPNYPNLDTYRLPQSHTYRSNDPKLSMNPRSKTYNITSGLHKEVFKPTGNRDFSTFSTDSWNDSENDTQNDQELSSDNLDRDYYSDVLNKYDRMISVPKVLDETTDSSISHGRKQIKRKILRRKDGAKIVDESITESEPDISADMRYLNEKLSRLPLHGDEQIPDRHNRAAYYPRRPQSAREEPPYRLDADHEGPTSLIKPLTEHPHKKNIKKNDPVRKYQEYKQAWVSQKAPGEKQHKGLRWTVREQMLYQDELPKKTQRVFAPNTYMVPTEKKRKALRWQVRNDIAQGLMPPTNFDLYDI